MEDHKCPTTLIYIHFCKIRFDILEKCLLVKKNPWWRITKVLPHQTLFIFGIYGMNFMSWPIIIFTMVVNLICDINLSKSWKFINIWLTYDMLKLIAFLGKIPKFTYISGKTLLTYCILLFKCMCFFPKICYCYCK